MIYDTDSGTERVEQLIGQICHAIEVFDSIILSNFRPLLNGERYISDKDLSCLLNINRRSLVQYRQKGLLPYYRIGGKIIYRESDIRHILENNYYDVLSRPDRNNLE